MYYIYVLQCHGGSLYAGITTDIRRRMRQHCGLQKGGAKYTRSHPPEKICCAWNVESHSVALQFEIYFKQLTHGEKEQLIAAPSRWAEFLPKIAKEAIVVAEVVQLAEYLC